MLTRFLRERTPGVYSPGLEARTVLLPGLRPSWLGRQLILGAALVATHSSMPLYADQPTAQARRPAVIQHAAAPRQQTEADPEISIDVVNHGSSSRRIRRSAINELPLDKLHPTYRQAVQGVIDDLSLFRRLPVVQIESDPRVLDYFLAEPDMAVNIWRAMGVTEMTMQKARENQYRSNSGDGSTGLITVIYRAPRQQIVFCDGTFTSPLLAKPVHARAIIHLHVDTVPGGAAPGNLCQADLFVSFPSGAVETVAKVVSPVSNRIVDQNFEEVATFIRMMHVAMSRQPGWVEQLTNRLPDTTQAQIDRLLELTAAIYVDECRRLAGNESLTPEDLRLPTRREPEQLPVEGQPAVRTAAQETGASRR